MGTKEELLTLFEDNKGAYLSGQELAGRLSVSRTAVWKAVNGLREDGFPIRSTPNRGYCLPENTDILSAQGIRKYLDPKLGGLDIEVFPVLPSTNDAVREKAAQQAPEGYIAAANEQTGGKGRRGRSFFSPPDTGLYLSVLLRPAQFTAEQAVGLTTMAAVAVCEAIESIGGERAQIKWVNDIYVGGKKVCGILTEAAYDLESGGLEYAVLGIGVNMAPPEEGFPDSLQDRAGTLFPERISDGKNRLAAAFLNRFMASYAAPQPERIADQYRRRSLVIGKEIRVLRPDGAEKAVALDIDDACHLIVRYPDGRQEKLSSGEISTALS